MRRPVVIRNALDIRAFVHETGFMPFYSSPFDAYSLRAFTSPAIWASNEQDVNPWYYRQEIALDDEIVYGRFFAGKLGFIDLRCFPDFVLLRRTGWRPEGVGTRSALDVLDAQGMFEAGLLRARDFEVLETLPAGEFWTEPAFRENLFEPRGLSPALERLQTATLLVTAAFESKQTRSGRPYGWPLSSYARPEDVWSRKLVLPAQGADPAAAYERLAARIRALVPDATDEDVNALLLLAPVPKRALRACRFARPNQTDRFVDH